MTADRLRVISSVQRVAVLFFTCFTHLKKLHGCIFTVIRQVVNDGVAYSAVCAGDERIPVTAVRGVEQLCLTLAADTYIRRYAYGFSSIGAAGDDLKTRKLFWSCFFSLYILYASQRRQFCRDRV